MSNAMWLLAIITGLLTVAMLRDIHHDLEDADECRGTRERWRVRVWFGEQVISDRTADWALARRFEAPTRRRFPSLTVTSERVSPQSSKLSNRRPQKADRDD